MSSFPQEFVWGVSSSAYQIEGAADTDGRTPSVWDTAAARRGFVTDHQTGAFACDSYNRVDEDADLVAGLGVNASRFSLSWSRVLPEGLGRVNKAGLDYYDRVVDSLLARGVEPWVTLFHWDYPQVLYDRGGWMNSDSPAWFGEYATVVADRLGDRVKHWMTLNEPQCFVGLGHSAGEHAPGLRLPRRDVLVVLHRSLVAHGKAVQALRANAGDHKVGWAPVGVTAYPDTDRPEDIEAARRFMFEQCPPGHAWSFSNALYADPVIFGRYPNSTYGPVVAEIPAFPSSDLETISQPIDFYGVNIYQGTRVRAGADGTPEVVPAPPGQPRTMMDWPVTPEALYWGPRLLAERYKLPVYITENGCATSDWVSLDGAVHDPARIDYLDRHLRQLARAIDDGVDIRGYFLWSILDNFEWGFGYTKRFGLVHVDFETGRRTPKDSYAWYRSLIATNQPARA
ncbi:MAG: beta-glucosidase [Phycisphaeraceae bacterium]|nr:MAG: beta-glucosidase [Phycisphaeraceae bacterium]